MCTLLIDTASSPPCLALCDEHRTLALRELPGAKDDALLPMLDAALVEANLGREAIKRIACIVGPGGFTSIRVGVTAANALASTLGILLVGIHLSDLWAERIREESPSFLWLHSTRRNALFVRGFGAHAKQFPEPTLLTLEEAAALKGGYVGELLEEHRDALPSCVPLPASARHSLEDILPKFLATLEYGKQSVIPWYGREA